MSIETFERREKLLELKEKLLIAEEQRIRGDRTLSIKEVHTLLKEKVNGK